MATIEIPYKPRELQKFLHENISKHRFSVLVLHRRAGKTVMCINHMIREALLNPNPSSRYAFLSPTFKQGKATAWDYIKTYAGKIPGTKFNESELRCDFPNGSRITILGGENDQALRGIALDGCVFDETQSISPSLFPEIIRPALADRKGWCVFIGTPKGRNYFYDLYCQAKGEKDWYAAIFKASETKILDEEELRSARQMMSEDLYDQEFECSFQAAITGSYYGAVIERLEKENKITDDLYDESLDVETWWDLGMNDSTVITFAQRRPSGEIRIIDCYENSGEGLEHYINIVDSKPYKYSKHIAPHDIRVREIGTNKSRWETAKELGLEFDIAPKLSVEDGIEQVRRMLPKCFFHKNNCNKLVEALKSYCKRWDEKNNCFRNKPLHNWASHFCDSVRYGAVTEPLERSDWSKPIRVDTNYIV